MTPDERGAGAASDTTGPFRRGGLRIGLAAFARYAVTLFVVVTFIFFVPRALPGDPLDVLQGEGLAPSPEVRARLLAEHGLDRPLIEQYGRYLARIARGDFGTSVSLGPVSPLLADRLPWTLLLLGTSVLLSAVLSLRAGIASAWDGGRRGHRKLLVAITGLDAVPDYALAPLILIMFAGVIPLFPPAGGQTPFAVHSSPLAAVGDLAVHLALPAAALTLSLMAAKFLVVRASVTAALGADFMVLARAKGLPERGLKRRHAGRNALLPFLAVLAGEFGLAVRGVVVVEAVFAYPGIAGLMLPAAQNLDYPVMEGCFLVLAVLALTANMVVDVASRRLDPWVGDR